MRHFQSTELRNRDYYFRIKITVICTLIFFILLFRFWPGDWGGRRDLTDRFGKEDVIMPEMIIASQQAIVERIAPPVPRPEVALPDEDVVDMAYDLDLRWEDSDFASPFPEERDEVAELVASPDRPPNVRRIVEPVMPSEARRDGVRVEIVVLFVVSAEGEVEEAAIDEIRVYNGASGAFEVVDSTGYGFREITLRAAYQWLFHPAVSDGEQVRARSRHRFSFGNR